jgi:hypothetical protein
MPAKTPAKRQCIGACLKLPKNAALISYKYLFFIDK